MTLNGLVWDKFVPLEDDSEVVSMTLVLKDKDGNLTVYGVDSYGCFYKVD